MIREYLEQQGERVNDYSELRKGEIYAVVHNDGFIGFVMPKEPILLMLY